MSAATVSSGDQAEDRGWFARHWQLEQPRDDLPNHRLRSILLVMGLPTLGLAFAISMLTTYGPVILESLAHSSFKVGLLIGGEGAFALVIPVVAGGMSDTLKGNRFGRRLPFVMVGAPLVIAGLILLPLARGLFVAGIAIILFYVGYYLFYPPYRAIYADVLTKDLYARAQASQAILRGAGLGGALLAGGFLLHLSRELPFVVAASLLGVTAMALLPVSKMSDQIVEDGELGAETSGIRQMLLGNHDLQLFAVANALWEFAFAGLKTFVVLYVIDGLGRSSTVASAVIAVVAVAYIAGAPLAAWLSDRFGMVPVMLWSAGIFGVGLCLGLIPTSLGPLLLLLPFVALAGAVLLTLPQALAFLCAPTGSQGVAAGIVDLSRGFGLVFGPIAVGAAVGLSKHTLVSTHGYAAMFPVIGIANIISLPVLARLRRVDGAMSPRASLHH